MKAYKATKADAEKLAETIRKYIDLDERNPMKAYKVTLLIIDLDEIGAEEIKDVIENVHYPNRCISPDVAQIEAADIGEWSDDHPLNGEETAPAEWRRLFPSLGDWNP